MAALRKQVVPAVTLPLEQEELNRAMEMGGTDQEAVTGAASTTASKEKESQRKMDYRQLREAPKYTYKAPFIPYYGAEETTLAQILDSMEGIMKSDVSLDDETRERYEICMELKEMPERTNQFDEIRDAITANLGQHIIPEQGQQSSYEGSTSILFLANIELSTYTDARQKFQQMHQWLKEQAAAIQEMEQQEYFRMLGVAEQDIRKHCRGPLEKKVNVLTLPPIGEDLPGTLKELQEMEGRRLVMATVKIAELQRETKQGESTEPTRPIEIMFPGWKTSGFKRIDTAIDKLMEEWVDFELELEEITGEEDITGLDDDLKPTKAEDPTTTIREFITGKAILLDGFACKRTLVKEKGKDYGINQRNSSRFDTTNAVVYQVPTKVDPATLIVMKKVADKVAEKNKRRQEKVQDGRR